MKFLHTSYVCAAVLNSRQGIKKKDQVKWDFLVPRPELTKDTNDPEVKRLRSQIKSIRYAMDVTRGRNGTVSPSAERKLAAAEERLRELTGE